MTLRYLFCWALTILSLNANSSELSLNPQNIIDLFKMRTVAIMTVNLFPHFHTVTKGGLGVITDLSEDTNHFYILTDYDIIGRFPKRVRTKFLEGLDVEGIEDFIPHPIWDFALIKVSTSKIKEFLKVYGIKDCDDKIVYDDSSINEFLKKMVSPIDYNLATAGKIHYVASGGYFDDITFSEGSIREAEQFKNNGINHYITTAKLDINYSQKNYMFSPWFNDKGELIATTSYIEGNGQIFGIPTPYTKDILSRSTNFAFIPFKLSKITKVALLTQKRLSNIRDVRTLSPDLYQVELSRPETDLRPSDVILEVILENKKVFSFSNGVKLYDFYNTLNHYSGNELTLKIIRDQELIEMTVKIPIASPPSRKFLEWGDFVFFENTDRLLYRENKMKRQGLYFEIKNKNNFDIDNPCSGLDKYDARQILEIDGKTINTLEELNEVLPSDLTHVLKIKVCNPNNSNIYNLTLTNLNPDQPKDKNRIQIFR